jgi:hypothetical protein
MNDYSITHYNFVNNPRQSNTSRTVNKAVIRNDTGNLQVWQCRGKLREVPRVSLNKQAFNDRTVGDLLNQFKQRMTVINIVHNCK